MKSSPKEDHPQYALRVGVYRRELKSVRGIRELLLYIGLFILTTPIVFVLCFAALFSSRPGPLAGGTAAWEAAENASISATEFVWGIGAFSAAAGLATVFVAAAMVRKNRRQIVKEEDRRMESEARREKLHEQIVFGKQGLSPDSNERG